jgi:hypothetical protein
MKHSPNERRVVWVSWSGFTGRALMPRVRRCLRLWNSDEGVEGIIRQCVRSLILSIGGTDTRIDGHLTHKLRVWHDISLKYVQVISNRLRRWVWWVVCQRVIGKNVNILSICRKTCAIKLDIFIWIKLSKINSI